MQQYERHPEFDAYLEQLPEPHRAALRQLRDLIHRLMPEVEEYITYRLPAFRLHGKGLVALGAGKSHCALYPMSGSITTRFAAELNGFSLSKGTIRFRPDQPLPDALVARILDARRLENQR